jgi:hypothetical protein
MWFALMFSFVCLFVGSCAALFACLFGRLAVHLRVYCFVSSFIVV